jgi:PIN domain nuclease of toxin-antitoxin system
LNNAAITAVNACEVVSKLISRDVAAEEAIASVVEMDIPIAPFDDRLAFEAATILPTTRPLGLSLGDRACLAYARLNGTSVLTADRAWKKLATKLGVDIRVIR